jgi:hypothetical protein
LLDVGRHPERRVSATARPADENFTAYAPGSRLEPAAGPSCSPRTARLRGARAAYGKAGSGGGTPGASGVRAVLSNIATIV